MIDGLEALSITNFRSIRGTVTIPLAAPIVLIHGPNGAGKTSVLSALELAMTGDIAAMRRDDEHFLKHLVHEGTDRADMKFTGGGAISSPLGSISVTGGQIVGQPLLDAQQAQFFSERCYLAQSVLGRLLEIYQRADPQRDSALTRFVKDLLGLDQLDALVTGLHDAGDIRRTKNLAPEFRAAEDRCKVLRAERDAAKGNLTRLAAALASQRQAYQTLAAALPADLIGSDLTLADLAVIVSRLERPNENDELVRLAQRRRELNAIRNSWTALPANASANERTAAEADEASLSAVVSTWREATGVELERLLDQLRTVFPDLPSWASTNPQTAHETAKARAQAELQRLELALARDRAATSQMEALDEDIQKAEARIKLVDDQIGSLAEDANDLAQALAGVTPHIHGEDCPVCGRDFAEVSEEPLLGHLQRTIASLTEQAGRLSALAQEKSAATARLAGLQRDRETEKSKQLGAADRLVYQARLASLTGSSQALSGLEASAALGAGHLRRLADAQRRLSVARNRDRMATDLRTGLAALCVQLGQSVLNEAEPLNMALDRLDRFVADEERRLNGAQQAREGALEACVALVREEKALSQADAAARATATELELAEAAFNAADALRLQAKAIGQAARDARTTIVRRVFNQSLNTLWRDLFVRLAPTEPFVPAFKLPETPDGVVAALETLHRSGHRGGTPGSMLSAGNLNTAALTLFLALHLSVKPRLPWLVLDDPVQSMDEVHIAQFAALLRTLSKAHGRKILIAVHDRPLFEYLALELSPAFVDDQLITVELSRSASDATIATPRFWPYLKDEAIAA